jgi:hypothetical protein
MSERETLRHWRISRRATNAIGATIAAAMEGDKRSPTLVSLTEKTNAR